MAKYLSHTPVYHAILALCFGMNDGAGVHFLADLIISLARDGTFMMDRPGSIVVPPVVIHAPVVVVAVSKGRIHYINEGELFAR